MNQKCQAPPLVLNSWYIPAALLFVIAFLFSSCKSLEQDKEGSNQKKSPEDYRISWNILFKPGTNKNTRDDVIKKIEDYVQSFYDAHNLATGRSDGPKHIKVIFCPCDTLLYNFSFLPLGGATGSVATAPTRPTGPKGSGDFMDALVANNIPIAEPQKIEKEDSLPYIKNSALVKNFRIDTSKRLAIIDSGIDTTLFTGPIQNLIWNSGAVPTIYNFMPGQPLGDLSDQTRGKHGSAVAAIITKALEKTAIYPKIMVLKALDRENKGSTFSVSCALSYTIQKHATMVNLSLGYYGAPDPILHHYLDLCAVAKPSIQVFAAAGNTPHHGTPHICDPNFLTNLLTGTRLFYPACFSQYFNNLTSVTQINNVDVPCFYQNYSNQFINLGVYDKIHCCESQVGFLRNNTKYYEGSSFATPAAIGLKMGTILQTGSLNATNPLWDNLIKVDPLHKVTIGGKYIQYTPNF